MSSVGEYDCANADCPCYHALVERRITLERHPQCPECGKTLRLVRTRTKMDEATKARLRTHNERRPEMSKPVKEKKVSAKTRKPAVVGTKAPRKEAPRENLCVFAFRLTAEERDAIHEAAGPAKASKFARTLLVAAARKDTAAIEAIVEGVPTP